MTNKPSLQAHTMSQQLPLPSTARVAQRGLSLIELLVAMAIGLVVTLAITTVLINSQGQQRTSTSLNDASQTGAYAALTLDRATRSAGSGFTQFRAAMGCVLNAGITSPATKKLLPVPTAAPWPTPFANVNGGTGLSRVVLAPVVIIDGGGANGSDQLVVMTGNHAFSETPRPIDSGSATTNSVNVSNTMGMRANDLVLVADATAGSGCMVQQIAAPVLQTQVQASGPYFESVGTTRSLASFAATSAVVPLGWMSSVAGTPSNPPAFMIYGLGDNNTLFSYDILNTTDSTSVQLAENVFSMQALYGVSTSPTAIGWVAPTGTTYGSAALWGATNLAQAQTVHATLLSIRAVRVAMVLVSALEEKETSPPVSPASLVLFPDLPAAQQVTINLTTAQRNFRYRIVETVIPIMNL
jgi:type IV pilus assembly protein PilW